MSPKPARGVRPIDWAALVLAVTLWGLATGSPLMRAEEEPGVQPPVPLIIRETRIEPRHKRPLEPEDEPPDGPEGTQLAGDP